MPQCGVCKWHLVNINKDALFRDCAKDSNKYFSRKRIICFDNFHLPEGAKWRIKIYFREKLIKMPAAVRRMDKGSSPPEIRNKVTGEFY